MSSLVKQQMHVQHASVAAHLDSCQEGFGQACSVQRPVAQGVVVDEVCDHRGGQRKKAASVVPAPADYLPQAGIQLVLLLLLRPGTCRPRQHADVAAHQSES